MSFLRGEERYMGAGGERREELEEEILRRWRENQEGRAFVSQQRKLRAFCAGVLVSRASITKYHKLGGLKQQKVTLSQFWRPKVQNQGVARLGSSQKF